jgi:SAM-dependent methyltransferase
MTMHFHNHLIHKINTNIAESLPYDGRVIDLGCGRSPYKEIILRKASAYIGVDWANSLHDQSNVDVFANLCGPLPFEDDYADTLVSFQVMEHLPEPLLFLKESYRILKKGGKIFLTVPFMWHIHEQPYDYYRFTRYGLEYLFTKAGFKDIKIIENTGFWQMWTLKFNYYTKKFGRGPLKILWIPFWWLGQVISPVLDNLDRHPIETASYTAVATKK